jgi:DedD protein
MAWAFWRRSSAAPPESSPRAWRNDDDVAALRVDPIAPLRARNRRRLIGAAALLLAVVIIVPLILDPAPRPLPPSVPIVLPSEKTPFTPRLSLPQHGAAPLAPPPDIRESGATEPVPPDAVSGAAAKAEAKADGAGRNAGAEFAPAPAPAAAPAPASAPAAAPPEKAASGDAKAANRARGTVEKEKREAKAKADEARAREALEGKVAAAEPAAPARARFVVQAAALASEAAANELAERIRQAGVTTYTERVQAGELVRWRVRAGPYATRDEAQRARGRLKDLGIEATLVAP